MSVTLNREDMNGLTRFLAQHPEFEPAIIRHRFLPKVFAGIPRSTTIIGQVSVGAGASASDAFEVVNVLCRFGQVVQGYEALGVLVDYLLENHGEDETAQFLQSLFPKYNLKTSMSPVQLNITPVTAPALNGTPSDVYVFISYARSDEATADSVEQFLQAAGFKIFRDKSSIRSGDNWPLTIDKAVDEAHRMVLLLSQASMPYREEVYREWAPFQLAKKRIHPLYIQECKLPGRLQIVNYIDARTDWADALNRLARELVS